MTEARMITTDKEIERAIAQAQALEPFRLRALAARYRPDDDVIVVDVAIPRKALEGLENATPDQLAKVQIEGPGTDLHWPDLDVDHYIPGIFEGVFGTRRWMSEIGRKGGSQRSSAKTRAAQANGKKGGRPSRFVPRSSSWDSTTRVAAKAARRRVRGRKRR
jgi:general stress protein YciG